MSKVLFELPFVDVARKVADRPSLSVEVDTEAQSACVRNEIPRISIDNVSAEELQNISLMLTLDEKTLNTATLLRRRFQGRLSEVAGILKEAANELK